MRNADYWRQRARINSDAAHAEANEYIAQLEEIYRDAVMSVKAGFHRPEVQVGMRAIKSGSYASLKNGVSWRIRCWSTPSSGLA